MQCLSVMEDDGDDDCDIIRDLSGPVSGFLLARNTAGSVVLEHFLFRFARST